MKKAIQTIYCSWNRDIVAYWSVLGLFGLFFFWMNCLTPFKHDDFAYMFYYGADSNVIRPTSTPVTWTTLMSSMWHHYNYVNGRFTSHILIQLFCGLLGKGVFNVVNTLVFVWMLHLMVSLSAKSKSIVTLCMTIAAVFLFFPFPGQTMLWLSGAINYLWATTFSLAILKYILDNNSSVNRKYHIYAIAFFAGTFVGWMQESISIGVSGGLFIWFLFNRKKFVAANLWLTVGYWLGTLLIIFGPGTLNRIQHGGELRNAAEPLQLVTSRLLEISIVLIPYLLPFVAMAIGVRVVMSKNTALKKEMLLPLLVSLISLLFLYALGMPESRIFFGAIAFSWWCVIKYLCETVHVKSKYIKHSIAVATLIVSSYLGVNALNVAYDYNKYSTKLTEKIMAAGDRAVIEIKPFLKSNGWVLDNGMSSCQYNFHNRVRAFYYNKKSIQALPPAVYRLYEQSEIKGNMKPINLKAELGGITYDVNELYGTNYWIIEIPRRDLINGPVLAYYSMQLANDKLAPRQRMIRYLMNSLPKDKIKDITFTLSDQYGTYVLFPNKTEVKTIQLLPEVQNP